MLALTLRRTHRVCAFSVLFVLPACGATGHASGQSADGDSNLRDSGGVSVRADEEAGATAAEGIVNLKPLLAQRIVISGDEELSNGSTLDLYSFNLDGSDAVDFLGVLVTTFTVPERGARLISRGVGGARLYDVDGTNSADMRFLGVEPSLTSSGRFIVYAALPVDGQVGLYAGPSDGSAGTKIADVPEHVDARLGAPSSSSDLMVYGEFAVVDAAQSKVHLLPDAVPRPVTSASWSPDGKSLAYLALVDSEAGGVALRTWSAEDQTTRDLTTKDLGIIPGGPHEFTYPRWSRNGQYLSVGRGASSQDRVILASADGRSRLLEDVASVATVSNDGWTVASRPDGSLHSFDLGAAEFELFDANTTNRAGAAGFVAGCDPVSSEIVIKAANGTTIGPSLEGTQECFGWWSAGGYSFAYASDSGKVGVYGIGQAAPQVFDRGASSPVTRIRPVQNGEGFLVGDDNGANAWVYFKDGAYQWAQPELPLLVVSLAAFGGAPL